MVELGISQRDAVRRQVRRIVEHCLKLQYSAARDPRAGWHEISSMPGRRSRTRSRDDPARPAAAVSRVWQQARRNTAAPLRLHGEHADADALPAECPYRLPDLLRCD
jgi:Domain of unknown function DUF29